MAMLQRERQASILHLLEINQFMTVHALVEALGTSPITVRRDLSALAKDQLLKRVRGGVESASPQWSSSLRTFGIPPFSGRLGINEAKKRAIARSAVELCEDHETIIIDGGTTTFAMAEFLSAKPLKVLTNSFAMAYALRNGPCQVVLAGGMLYPQAELILDPFDSDPFRNYAADKVFMGISGLDERGATNTNTLVLQTEKNMISRGKRLIILADSSKFGARGNLSLCPLASIDTLITDDGIPPRAQELLMTAGVKVLITGENP